MNQQICGYVKEYPIYRFIFEPINSNMYIIVKSNQALVVDPFFDDCIKKFIQNNEITDVTILLTHEHYDHISGVNGFRELCDCTVFSNQYTKEKVMSPNNNLSKYFMALFINKPVEEEIARKKYIENYVCKVDVSFIGNYEMIWNDLSIAMQETPGHTDGSICIMIDGEYVFTGDTLVEGNKIITRLPGGSKKKYFEYTKPYLTSLGKNIFVLPGHGTPGFICEFDIL